MNELKDYLHLYLGCEGVAETIAPFKTRLVPLNVTNDLSNGVMIGDAEQYKFKPILRPLSDMTEEEKKQLLWDNDTQQILAHFKDDDAGLTRNEFLYLLSNHFDLFGLIDAGLAIDKNMMP